MDDLEKIRARIDKIDEQIQALVTERAECAREVAKQKGLEQGESIIYRPEREAEILRTVTKRNHGPLSDEAISRLFREIMSVCRDLQQPLRIAYLGPEGTFTQEAALKHFGHSSQTTPYGGIDEVFRSVDSGDSHYGVVPIENSTEGVVTHTLDMFMNSNLQICGEVELRIHHHLLSRSKDMGSIKRVYTHQQSLGQCRGWLDSNLPGAERIAMSSNAEAARHAAKEKHAAAIASDAAAKLYEIPILVSNIEDNPDNTTRFLVIGRQKSQPSGHDKTSLLLSTNNRAGALYKLLEPFASNNLSMTRIESRPSRQGIWEYVFFIDISGHASDDAVAKALKQLEKDMSMVKVLGSYPCSVL